MSTRAAPGSLPPHLTADCAACSGICCVALPFDADQGFGFDKAAHTACPHLGADFRCGIHGSLSTAGFPGCVSYDCHGAGQRVTRAHADRPWTGGEGQAQAMFASFSRVKPLHDLMALLATALAHVPDRRIQGLIDEIDAQCESVMHAATPADLDGLRQKMLALLGQPEIATPLKALRAPAVATRPG